MLTIKSAKALIDGLDEHVVYRIRRLDRSFTDGNDHEIVLHPWNRVDLDEVLDEVKETVLSFNGPLEYETLELDNLAKFGPRSVQVPGFERLEGLREYWEFNDVSPSTAQDLFYGVEDDDGLVQAFLSSHTGGTGRKYSLHPVGRETAEKALKSASTSGLPDFKKKGQLTREELDNAWRDWDNLEEIPMLLFTRTQEQKKTRPVMGVPVSTTLGEMRFYLPYQGFERELVFRTALRSPDYIRSAVSNLVRKPGNILSLDYSAFDTSVSPEIIYEAFGLLHLLFDRSHSDEIFTIAQNFVEIPMYLNGDLWTGCHGIPSGSTFTNAIGSLVSWIVCFKAIRDLNFQEMVEPAQIQGDDGLVYFKGPISDLNQMKEDFISQVGTYGLVINESKSHYSSEYCMYLQHLCHSDMPPMDSGDLSSVYSGIRAFNRLVHPERFPSLMQDYDMTESAAMKLRTLGILNMCVSHPMFNQLTSIIRKYDPQTFSGDISVSDQRKFKRYLDDRRAVGIGHFIEDLEM